ncbi:MAG: glucuronate isomerase, partial [Planctomycetales bacterium]|nr:glucuronate isomerase [Planctomycetales bacterium]
TLYAEAAKLPLVCPHGHVDPRLFVSESYRFGSPTELFLIPDHYLFRMLYSQGVPMESLGVPRVDGGPVEQDHRKIWQTFADHFYLFRGTPSGGWFADELSDVFGIDEKLSGGNAQAIYDQIDARLQDPGFTPRNLYERFDIEVLCTTDAAADDLASHQAIRDSGWKGRILPTFRPDAVVNLDAGGWLNNISELERASGQSIGSYRDLIAALENRRAYFKTMGAKATDHAALTAYTGQLSDAEADSLLQKAFKGEATPGDAQRFTGHMLIEMARMSVEDGLVMQLHVGSRRNHNRAVYERFGLDKGCDIPLATEFTRNLEPLLSAYGADARLGLILFTLDEATYARELAPLAGHYPSLRLGPPWWFHDSPNGMRRFFDQVIETAGLYNTAGFNDDTRAFLSIPARHDVWRRVSADWAAGLVVRHVVDEEDAASMVRALAYDLVKDAYRLHD